MPETGPGGLDNHTHSFEWNASVTSMSHGHVHIMKPNHAMTAPADGHDHTVPMRAPRGIDQEVFDREIGQ